MAALGAHYKDFVLNWMLNNAAVTRPTAWYISLHTADPGTSGANEVSGGSYARQKANADDTGFAPASGGTASTDAAVSFTGMPAVGSPGVQYVGVWDHASSTDDVNFICGGPLAAAKIVNAGDTFTLASGDLDIALA